MRGLRLRFRAEGARLLEDQNMCQGYGNERAGVLLVQPGRRMLFL